MQSLHRMERSPYLEVLAKQLEVWEQLIVALKETWDRAFSPDCQLDPQISPQEIWADLTHGRD